MRDLNMEELGYVYGAGGRGRHGRGGHCGGSKTKKSKSKPKRSDRASTAKMSGGNPIPNTWYETLFDRSLE